MNNKKWILFFLSLIQLLGLILILVGIFKYANWFEIDDHILIIEKLRERHIFNTVGYICLLPLPYYKNHINSNKSW